MQAFEYVPAATIKEATSILAREGDQARVLSGGTDLIVQLREGRRKVRTVVDIKHIPEVNELSYDASSGLRIGSAVPCYRIYSDTMIAAAYPGLIDAVSLIGGMQVQGRASLGGNLCNASPAADSIPALIALRAVANTISISGERHIPVEEFCIAPGRTQLRQDELLLSLSIPAPAPNSSCAYLRFIPRNEMDIAVVGVGVWVELDHAHGIIQDARVALGAVAPTPLFVPESGAALRGKSVSVTAFKEAAAIAQAAAKPISDMRGSAAQRIHLVEVLTRRALQIAVERASG